MNNNNSITRHYGDIFLFIVFVISIFGAMMVYSATAQKGLDPTKYFKMQMMYIFIGIIFCGITTNIKNKEIFKKVSWPLLIINIILLVIVFFFEEKNGARRWISFSKFNFQPAELAKLSIVLFTASYLDKHRSKILGLKKEMKVLLLMICLTCGLILFEPDLGIPFVILLVSLILLSFAGLRKEIMFKVISILVLILVLSVLFSKHRVERVRAFFASFNNPKKVEFHKKQSCLALTYGHLTGRGLGKSQFKENYLPEPHTDFIFSIIGEEFGFLGTTFTVLSFAVLFFLGIKMAEQVKSFYGNLLIYGLILNIVLQAYINIGVVIGLLPTKGLGLPFISYGGSALVVNFISVGVILSIWRHNQ